MNKKVSLVITDLDNTLYDWLAIWHSSFSAMFEEVVKTSGVGSEQLKKEFRAVFQKHRTSEYAFALQELPSLLAKHPASEIPAVYASAIDAYREARRANLTCYDDVLDTLRDLKAKGCMIVAYTESMSFYTNHRLKKLGLDLIIDYLYTSPDHAMPENVTPEQIRKYPPEHYQLRKTRHKFTPPNELKPNPKLLLDIVTDVGGEEGRTIYIGDSLMKDIAMAQQARITDVWAEYGAGTNRSEYELLRSVSHWPETTVQKEKSISVTPSFALHKSLKEVLSLFDFIPFDDEGRDDKVLDMWKTTVSVQQHFNDLELRIRNYAVTLLVAVLGVTAVALKDNNHVVVFGFDTTLPPLILCAGLIGWLGFYFMDRFWYHRLLLGAVNHGRAIEDAHSFDYPEILLTNAIGKASPIELWGYACHGKRLRTNTKIDVFYLFIASGLIMLIVVMMVGNPATNRAGNSSTNNAEKASATNTTLRTR